MCFEGPNRRQRLTKLSHHAHKICSTFAQVDVQTPPKRQVTEQYRLPNTPLPSQPHNIILTLVRSEPLFQLHNIQIAP